MFENVSIGQARVDAFNDVEGGVFIFLISIKAGEPVWYAYAEAECDQLNYGGS
jgi:hypothetical protein